MSLPPIGGKGAMRARSGATYSGNRKSLGPCFRCGAPGAPFLELGDPATEWRLCPPCASELGARPLYSHNRDKGYREALEPSWCDIESAETTPDKRPLTPEEFRALAERMVGRERAEEALRPEVDWNRRLYKGGHRAP